MERAVLEDLEFAEKVALCQASGLRKGIICAVVLFTVLAVGAGLIIHVWWQVLVFAAGLCIMVPIWDRQAKHFEYAAQEMRAVIDGKSSGLSASALKVLNESKESPKRMYISALAIGILVVVCVGLGIMLICLSRIFDSDAQMFMAGLFIILLGFVAATPTVQWLRVAGMLKRRSQ